jgi:hypothetical protein
VRAKGEDTLVLAAAEIIRTRGRVAVSSQVESVLGFLAGVIGVVAPVWFLLAIGWEHYENITLLYAALVIVSAVGVAAGAWEHSRTGLSGWLVVLWISTVALLAFNVLGLASVGIFLLPATLLALIACLVATLSRRRSVSE